MCRRGRGRSNVNCGLSMWFKRTASRCIQVNVRALAGDSQWSRSTNNERTSSKSKIISTNHLVLVVGSVKVWLNGQEWFASGWMCSIPFCFPLYILPRQIRKGIRCAPPNSSVLTIKTRTESNRKHNVHDWHRWIYSYLETVMLILSEIAT